MSDYLLTVDQKNDLLVRPGELRDRYQSALCELVEAKTKGLATTPRAIAEPPKVINLMEALKRSVARGAEPEPKEGRREQTHACKSCPRPASTGAATARTRRSREEERTRCGAGCFNRPKAPEEGRMTLVR